MRYQSRQDKYGNCIGDGSCHVPYHVEVIPNVTASVSLSESSESVYVTYASDITGLTATVRFSNHMNNAVSFGDQLDGNMLTKEELMFRLGMKKRKFIPDTELRIKWKCASKIELLSKEIADISIKEMYELGEGADLSSYVGKIAKHSNYLILGNRVEKVEVIKRDRFGNSVRVGKYTYFD